MKTLWKEFFYLIMNASNVADSIWRPLELEVAIRTFLCFPTKQSQKIFFEVNLTVVEIEGRSSHGQVLTSFHFATESSSALLVDLLLVTRGGLLGPSQPFVGTCWRDFKTVTKVIHTNVFINLRVFHTGLHTCDDEL